MLIVSHSRVVAKLASDTLRGAGYTPHFAENVCEARRLLQDEPDITVAILDGLSVNMDHGMLADELRELRQDLIVIGSSEGDDRQRFAELGITRFLPRFWDADELHRLLVAAIDSCPQCRVVLPLRRALPIEPARQFVCASCSAPLEGVMRADAPNEIRNNVREIG